MCLPGGTQEDRQILPIGHGSKGDVGGNGKYPLHYSETVEPQGSVDSTLTRKAPTLSTREPYRKPTQVDGCKCTKALERTLVKELGKITP